MAAEHLRWHGERRALEAPIMLAAFVRKNGFGTTAVAALTHLVTANHGELIAEIEPEDFYDFTVASPMLERRDDQRVLVWPQNRIHRLRPAGGSRDILVLLGTEPHLHWGGFAGALDQFISETGVGELVLVSSWPGALPHTRPVFLRVTTEDADLAERLGRSPAPLDYVGPVDFGTTLLMRLGASVRSARLSAIVPNYLGVVPNPLAIVAVIEACDRLCRTRTDLDAIRELAEQVLAKADEAVRESSELAEALRRMEEEYDAMVADSASRSPSADEDEDSLPSPDELLRDVEAFLNQERDAPP
ncbi:MAG: PAC2 family protein [Dehalococcoidia bacterium]